MPHERRQATDSTTTSNTTTATSSNASPTSTSASSTSSNVLTCSVATASTNANGIATAYCACGNGFTQPIAKSTTSPYDPCPPTQYPSSSATATNAPLWDYTTTESGVSGTSTVQCQSTSFQDVAGTHIPVCGGSQQVIQGTGATTSTSSSPTSVSTQNDYHSPLPGGAIAGVAIAGVVGASIVAGILAFLIIRRRRRRSQQHSDVQEKQGETGAIVPSSPPYEAEDNALQELEAQSRRPELGADEPPKELPDETLQELAVHEPPQELPARTLST